MEIGLPKELTFNRQKGEIVLFGMRHVFLDEFLLNALLSEFEREGGLITHAKIYRACKKAGGEYFKNLLSKSEVGAIMKKFGWGRNELIRQIQPLWSDYGLGVVESILFEEKRVVVRISNNINARTHERSSLPVCSFTQGILAGIASEAYNEEYDCEETKCIAMGDSYCEFVLTPSKK
ncbi:MAG: 4-vinyl reductase [Candidatus Micrarchaeia archaeon]